MKKIIFILLVIGTITGCEKNSHNSNNEFEDVKKQLLGEWIYIDIGGRFHLNFHENDSLDFIFEFNSFTEHNKFIYKLRTKDTLVFMNKDTIYESSFQIDSAGYLKIEELIYLRNYIFKKKIPCDEVCHDTLKEKITGKWNVINSYNCYQCNNIYDFNSNDTLYKTIIKTGEFFKYTYYVFSENYFGEISLVNNEEYIKFYNYRFHSDSVLEIEYWGWIETGIEPSVDTIILKKVSE